MRLINAKTLDIEEFFGDAIPEYAILSHTWGKDEVTLQEVQLQSREVTMKVGYQKIMFTCRQALEDAILWAWIDTCCIDKTSSTELSEAINSMYQWYTMSTVCYAFLSDFSLVRPDTYRFEDSRWFTRAWTLQELIAPPKVVFFDVNWSCIGNSQDPGLLETISRTTGIPGECLRHLQHPDDFSVAKRMSWAANRQCTRVEDEAYSLMGLFNVNMPLLYGEGKRAFMRLQEEILKDTDDQTLFAWTVPKDSHQAFSPVGVLAESTANFALSGGLVNIYKEKEPSTMTKLGLSISLPTKKHQYGPLSHLHQGCLARKINVFDAVLNCGQDADHLVVIRLLGTQPTQRSRGDGPAKSFYLLPTTRLDYATPGSFDFFNPVDIYIAKKVHMSSEDVPFGNGGIHLQTLPLWSSCGDDTDILFNYPFRYQASTTLGRVSPTTSERKVRFFKAYACVQFLASDLGYANDPIHIQFSSPLGPDFYVAIGYAENWIHLEIMLGTPKDQAEITRDSFMERFLDGRQSYRDRYGPIIQAYRQLNDRFIVTAVLHREDPNTDEGEAAGNRRHFLVFVNVNSARQKSVWGSETPLAGGQVLLKAGQFSSKSSTALSAGTKRGLKNVLKSIAFPRDGN